MKKKIFVHIGNHKTATTSVQYFLFKNRKYLLSKNLVYAVGGGIDYNKMALAMSNAQVSVSTQYDSFSSNSSTAIGGRYQSTARYESKFA